MKTENTTPIIIIGMHRSGTSLISTLLQKSGVFFGHKKDINNESRFFLRLNRWLLSLAGASWDNPKPFEYIYISDEFQQQIQKRLEEIVRSVFTITYHGVADWIRFRSIRNRTDLWGWKDPQNTFTLPLWLRVFPHAKVINVYRHGIDVANSLYTREKKLLAQNNSRKNVLLSKITTLLPVIRGGFYTSPRCLDIHEAFHLWEEYMEQSGKIKEEFGSKIVNVKYENLLDDPKTTLSTLLDSLKITVDTDTIRAITSSIDKTRKYAYRKNNNLLKLEKTYRESLSKYSY